MRRLPTTAAWVRSQIKSFRICGGRSGTRACFFSKYFGFPCQFSFLQKLNTPLTSGAGTLRQLVADVTKWIRLTTHYGTKTKDYIQRKEDCVSINYPYIQEECCLLGCGVVQILCEPTFRRNVSPPSYVHPNRRFTQSTRRQIPDDDILHKSPPRIPQILHPYIQFKDLNF
jgi:hypothetical protein